MSSKNKKQRKDLTKPKTKVIIKKEKNKLIPKKNTNNINMCKEWIIKQNNENYPIEIDENGDAEEKISDNELSEKNCVKNLNQLSKRGKTFKPKSKVMFLCEWLNCNLELNEEKEYCEHVETHIQNYKLDTDMKGSPIHVYTCNWNICTFQTLNKQSFSRHIHYHAYHTRIKSYGESLRHHVSIPPCLYDSRTRNIIENSTDDYICLFRKCLIKFNSINLFFEHIKCHVRYIVSYAQMSNSKKFVCGWSLCKKSFNREYRLMEHLRSHTKEKIVGCPHCGVMFCSNTKYYDHCKRQVTTTNEQYQCSHCYKCFTSERILKNHLSLHINCYKCSNCDMTCASVSKLSQHIRFKHMPVKPYNCDLCKFSFVMRSDLDRHKKSHSSYSFECEEFDCNYRCRSIYLLKRHDNQVHGNGTNIYACHCCDRQFDLGLKLSKHLIKEHNFYHPSGYPRFKYQLDTDGYYRLQTTRMESLEVTKQIIATNFDEDDEIFVLNPDKQVNEEDQEKINTTMLNNSEIVKENNVDIDNLPMIISNINDFKVMKKYITNKSIVIDVEDVDEKGIVLKTKTILTEEICFNK